MSCDVVRVLMKLKYPSALIAWKARAPRIFSSRRLLSRRKTTMDEERRSQRESLLQEASALTRSMYRTCVRSVRTIRYGNEADEEIFQEREQKRLEKRQESDIRLSMLSMLPPVDREDELRSRSEYYMQYTRENFVQESDCLDSDEWHEQHIIRYIMLLRRADEHRKWLLSDMKFPDPYVDSFDQQRVDGFHQRALEFINTSTGDIQQQAPIQEEMVGEDEADDFFDDATEDESVGLPPPWYKNPRSQY